MGIYCGTILGSIEFHQWLYHEFRGFDGFDMVRGWPWNRDGVSLDLDETWAIRIMGMWLIIYVWYRIVSLRAMLGLGCFLAFATDELIIEFADFQLWELWRKLSNAYWLNLGWSKVQFQDSSVFIDESRLTTFWYKLSGYQHPCAKKFWCLPIWNITKIGGCWWFHLLETLQVLFKNRTWVKTHDTILTYYHILGACWNQWIFIRAVLQYCESRRIHGDPWGSVHQDPRRLKFLLWMSVGFHNPHEKTIDITDIIP